MEAKTVDVSRGLSWLSCGWRIFTKNPWVWIMLGLVFPALMFVLAPIPLGTLVFALLVPPLVAGLLAAARDAEAGRALTFAHLFLAFRDKTRLTPLLVLGGVALAGVLASSGAAFMVAGNELLEMMETMREAMRAGMEFAPAPEAREKIMLALLVALAIQLLVTMALVYATPLVMFRGVHAGAAMRSSLNACLRNFLPQLVFGAVYLVFAVAATLPFMLGWIVLLPASAGMLYCSYKDLYGPG